MDPAQCLAGIARAAARHLTRTPAEHDLLDVSKLDQAAIKPHVDVYRLEELLAPLASEFDSVVSVNECIADYEVILADFHLDQGVLGCQVIQQSRQVARGAQPASDENVNDRRLMD